MEGVVEILEYPLQGEESTETLLYGAILLLFGFLLLPLVFLFGYVVRTVRLRREGTDEPPRFDDWRRLFTEGIYPWILSILLPVSVYLAFGGQLLSELVVSMAFRPHALLFIPFEAMLAVIQLVVGPPSLEGGAQGVLEMAGYGLLLVVSMCFVLLYGYLAGATIVTYIRTERMTAAIDTSALSVATDREYTSLWGVSLLTIICVIILGGLLADTIPVIGHAISAISIFYTTIVVAGAFGDRMVSIEGSPPEDALDEAAGSGEQRAGLEEEIEPTAPDPTETREQVEPRPEEEGG